MALRLIRDLVRGQVLLTCRPEATVREVAQQMAERHVGAILVMVEERLAGIFTERDALVRVIAAGRDPATTAIGEVMTHAVNTISPDRPVLHALHEMHENNFRHVPVVEHDRPVGIVSIRDALGDELIALGRELEVKQAILEVR
ncbi:MAG: CBS domain-containing protein [Acetobacteraceae bacterium]